MRISKIKLNNFRVYGGDVTVKFHKKNGKNISLIAGKNGFGKTTFLTSLIWGLYGKQMSLVEDKYKQEIRNSGGYDDFLKSLLNNNVPTQKESEASSPKSFFVEIELEDVLIPSIPCKKVVIKRFYNLELECETLQILIDDMENELTKEVGYEVFINDFILPREIAKFFFFDAEKIVALAEAKTKNELRTLSKAYSEVLGIKKYEDLKANLKTLLTKLKRSGVSVSDEKEVFQLEKEKNELEKLSELEERKRDELQREISNLKIKADQIQEQLIREGNNISLEELKTLKTTRDRIKQELEAIKTDLKQLMDLVPLAIALPRLKELVEQVKLEMGLKKASLNKKALATELESINNEFKSGLGSIVEDPTIASQVSTYLIQLSNKRLSNTQEIKSDTQILLDYDDETYRKIISTYEYLNTSFRTQFETIVKKDKDLRYELGRIRKKIRAGEARKDNPLTNKLREEKEELSERNEALELKQQECIQELAVLQHKKASNNKVLSEKLKKTNLAKADQKKFEITSELLNKLNLLTVKIKEEKKYSLQKSILLGLNKLMHKANFIEKVQVRIYDDVMDIDLIDGNNNIINKDKLSKGEQQLYATALLKALVDESGIDFPVFIDSPLQKFDKEHSINVIKQFYPSISEQVVLFPLLEKELSINEFDLLKPNLSDTYLIENDQLGSIIEKVPMNNLFKNFNKQHVLKYQD